MRRLTAAPWFHPVLFGAGGAACLLWGWARESPAVMASALVMFGFAWSYAAATQVRSRPLSGAHAHAAAGGVVVFWRPGCQFCLDLIRGLSPRQREAVYWVDVGAEPEAAAALRRLHARREGREHEAVPTAWTGAEGFIVADERSRERLRDLLGPV